MVAARTLPAVCLCLCGCGQVDWDAAGSSSASRPGVDAESSVPAAARLDADAESSAPPAADTDAPSPSAPRPGTSPEVAPLPESQCGSASETPELGWELRAGSATQDYVSAVAVDAEGNVYLTGMAGPNVDFGGGPLAGSGGYVVSLSNQGHYRWGRILEGSSWGSDIAISRTGRILVAGSFQGTLDLGGGPHVARGGTAGYLVSLTAQGDTLWDRTFGEGAINISTAVAAAPDGGVVLVGSYMASADFGGGTRAAGADQDFFVAAYDEDGTHRWDVTRPGPSAEIPIDVVVDSAGYVNVTGHFRGAWDLGGGLRGTAGNQGAFVLQLDEQGEYQWDWTHDFEGHGLGHAVAVDQQGSVFVTGEFSGTLRFAGTEHPPSSQLATYVLGFDADGSERWGSTFASDDAVRAFGIAVDDQDRVLVGGHFGGEARFGETARRSAGGYDVFALALTTSGEHLWDRTWGGSQNEEGHAISGGCAGAIFLGGRDPGNDSGSLVSMDALLVAFE